MDYKLTNNDNEFDFSIICNSLNEDCIELSECPENIDRKIFEMLSESVKDKEEYRFIGVIKRKEYYINRLYRRNGYIWENVFYDEFAELLNNIVDNQNFTRLHNCLMY